MARRILAGRDWGELPNLLSLLIFLGATALIFRSWEFGLIVTACLGFHELGHAAALWRYGLEYRISFGWVGAWTWSPLKERQRLSHLQNVIIHLAGPLASLLLAGIALWLWQFFPQTGRHLGILANFSAQVGLLNLLPLGSLTDGGKIMRRLALSLDGAGRATAVMLPTGAAGLVLAAYNLAGLRGGAGTRPGGYLLGAAIIGLWIGCSLLFEGRRPAFAEVDPARRASPWQAFGCIAGVWGLLILGMAITTATPFWLTPEYLMGTLSNVMAVLRLLI